MRRCNETEQEIIERLRVGASAGTNGRWPKGKAMRLVHSGHRADYALLVDRYGARLFAFVSTMVSRREDAEDLAQDCFVKAFRQLAQYDAQRSSFYTWLRRIAYRLCLDHIRCEPTRWLETDEKVLQALPDEEADSVMETDDDRRIQLLTQAIHQLPPTERLLVQQFYFEQQSLADISQVTDTDAGTLATRLHRIRKKLYQYIKIREHEQQTIRQTPGCI